MLCKRMIVGGVPDSNGWIRDTNWLQMPSIGASEQKVAALIAVHDNDSNYVSLKMRGAWTVDWGDGTVEDVADNTQKDHQYTFASLQASSLHPTKGYKQALVTVTPQAGQNLTVINFQVKHARAGLGTICVPWLDIVANTPSATTWTVGGLTVFLSDLERISVQSVASLASPELLVAYCFSIGSVSLPSNAQPTSAVKWLYRAQNTYAPWIDFSNATNATEFAAYAPSLIHIPAYNWNSVTTATNAFNTSPSIARINITNIGCTLSVASLKLGREGLLTLFGNLKSGVTGKTLTLDSNHGLVDLTYADWNIPAAKGWTLSPAGAGITSSDDNGGASPANVTLIPSGADYPIWYTTDGSDPIAGTATLYEGPIACAAATTIKAREYRVGYAPGALHTKSIT